MYDVLRVVSGTIAPPRIVYDYDYAEVPNDTYWNSYYTLFNFEYQDLKEGDGETDEENVTGFYILLALLGGILLFIIAMDMTNCVRKLTNYCMRYTSTAMMSSVYG